MSPLKQLWYSLVEQEQPILAAASRLAASDPALAADRITLFQQARKLVAADAEAAAVAAAIVRVDPVTAFRRDRRIMLDAILEPACLTPC